MSFQIVRNDITKMNTEAIVNMASAHPVVGAGCDSTVYKVAGYAASVVGIEPTYQKINGEWKNTNDDYATFHRLAISSKYRGMHLANFMFSDLISIMVNQGIKNFRIDTSRKNQIMQHLALKNNFIERGIIMVDEDPEDPSRLAYELNL